MNNREKTGLAICTLLSMAFLAFLPRLSVQLYEDGRNLAFNEAFENAGFNNSTQLTQETKESMRSSSEEIGVLYAVLTVSCFFSTAFLLLLMVVSRWFGLIEHMGRAMHKRILVGLVLAGIVGGSFSQVLVGKSLAQGFQGSFGIWVVLMLLYGLLVSPLAITEYRDRKKKANLPA